MLGPLTKPESYNCFDVLVFINQILLFKMLMAINERNYDQFCLPFGFFVHSDVLTNLTQYSRGFKLRISVRRRVYAQIFSFYKYTDSIIIIIFCLF